MNEIIDTKPNRFPNGLKSWWITDTEINDTGCHRIGGPAIIGPRGIKSWHREGIIMGNQSRVDI